MTCVVDLTPGVRQQLEYELATCGCRHTVDDVKYEAECLLHNGASGELLDCGNGVKQYSFTMIDIWVTLRFVDIETSGVHSMTLLHASCCPAGIQSF